MAKKQTAPDDLPLRAFTLKLVADLTGLSVFQLRRWDRNGFFHPSLADPDRRRPHSRIYSLRDVVVLRAIAELRKAGVSFTELKKVLSTFVMNDDGEWPVRSFYVVGNQLFDSRGDALAATKTENRPGEVIVVDMKEVTTVVEQGVRRLAERQPDQIGQVTRNRWIMGGAPIIAGTRIPTETIAWFHENGYSLSWILKEFPRLTPEDVQVAVAFENDSNLASRDLVLAQR